MANEKLVKVINGNMLIYNKESPRRLSKTLGSSGLIHGFTPFNYHRLRRNNEGMWLAAIDHLNQN